MPRLGLLPLTATAARRPAWACLAALATAVGGAAGGTEVTDGAALAVRVEMTSSAALAGELLAIDGATVDLRADGEPRRIPLGDVRMLVAVSASAGEPSPPAAVEVRGDRGLVISGDDVRWEGGRVAVVRGADEVELPVERVHRVIWRPPADAGDGDWLAAVPDRPTADLVAVSGSAGFDLVECAVVGIAPATVTVVLDGEKIPVARRKVLGLVMARPPTAETKANAAATPVVITGGAITAATVAWRDGELVLDGEIRVPGRMLRSIDFAAGRTARLVAMQPETVSSEPFFAGLTAIDGLAAFFAPRIVTPAAGPSAWLLRPRTTATWRVPDGSRRFRSRVVPAGGPSAAEVVVWARADDRPEWRHRLDGRAAADIEIDVREARRLTIGVEFPASGIGGPIRLDDAGFEQ